MKTIFIVLMSVAVLLAGDPERISQRVITFYPSITKDHYHLSGFADFYSVPASQISSSNPAAISHFEKISAGISFSYFTEIELIESVSLQRYRPWLPSSAGFVFPFHNFHFGASYVQKYSEDLTFGPIPLTTVTDPDGSSGQTVTLESETVVHSPSLLASYSVPDILNSGDMLTFGGQLYRDFWRNRESVDNRNIGKISSDGFTWKTGILYKFAFPLLVSFHYEKGIDMEGLVESESLMLMDSSNSRQFASVSIPLEFRLPDKLSTGFTALAVDQLWISANFSLLFWHNVYREYNNELDFSLNLRYDFSQQYAAAVGFFHNNKPLAQNTYGYFSEEDTNYLNAGFKAFFNAFQIHVEISDNRLLSSRTDETTLFNAGIDYQF